MKILFAVAAILFSGLGFAQYPNKPLTIVVGFEPGGGTDTTARIVHGPLGEQIGQQVVRTQWLYVPPHPAVLEAIVAEIGTTPTAVPSPGGSFWAAARSSW